jgi:putative ABC transport system permease protein
MWTNYFKVAFRNIKRQKFYSFTNIFGLSVGMASTILILLYVADELSYDKFHKDSDLIYRVGIFGRLAGQDFNGATSPAPMASTLVDEIPQINAAVRLNIWTKVITRYEELAFTEEKLLLADSNFFSFFSFKLIQGNKDEVLKGPNKLVITESAAKKYFGYSGSGDQTPIGKLLGIGNGSRTCEVVGIAEDPPANSHFHFTLIMSMDSWDASRQTQWTSNSFYTYYKTISAAGDMNPTFESLVDKYVGPEVKQYLGIDMNEFRNQGGAYSYILEPLTEIHLNSRLDNQLEPGGRKEYLYVFAAIAAFIILIACINFMNLTTARSADRAKEVGIRKTIGALRYRLMGQFFSESILFTLISAVISVLIIIVALPYFNTLSGKEIGLDVLMNSKYLLGILILIALVGIGAGSYPAIYLTSFIPAEVLKGRIRAGLKSGGIRSFLVVLQFSISIGLIISTLLVYQQLDLMQKKNLGFKKDNILVVDNAPKLGNNKKVFKDLLKQNPVIENVSFSNMTPPHIDNNSVFRPLGENAEDNLFFYFRVDEDYDELMALDLVQGRFFADDIASDSNAVILNEAAMKQLGWVDYEGKQLLSFNRSESGDIINVIGVIKDFNFESLRNEVKPLLFFNAPDWGLVSVRLKEGTDFQSDINFIEEKWKEFTGNSPFDFVFLDEDFDALFRAEQRMGNIFLLFTVLAIAIACLGLFGLASFTSEQRAKEISIRKVMGASMSQVVVLLSGNFTKLVLISFVIATPAAWYGMNKWLQGFAYRVEISILTIAIGGLVALVIAWLTISMQALKAAKSSPVNSLRAE